MDADRHQVHREHYAKLCLAGRAKARQAILQELQTREAELDRLTQRLTELVPRLESHPGWWLQRFLERRTLEQAAAAEFEALAEHPAVRLVDVDQQSKALLVTAAMNQSGNRRRRGERPVPLFMHIDLDGGSLALALGGTSPQPAAECRFLPLPKRLALGPAAAAMVAAGDLTGLVDLVVSSHGAVTGDGAASVTSSARDGYVRHRLSRLNASREPSGELADAERELASVALETNDVVQRMLLLARTLECDAGLGIEDAEAHRREYDLLCRLPGVKGIDVQGQVIRVWTEPIVIRHDGQNRWLGRFRMEIRPGDSVTMRNLDGKPAGKSHLDHPHVRNGQPCLGNMRHFFAERLAGHRYADIVQQGLEFLRSYNPSSCYTKIDAWPGYDPAQGEPSRAPQSAEGR